jgi:hypothetical protein
MAELTRSEHWALADEGCRGIARAAFRPAESGAIPSLASSTSQRGRRHSCPSRLTCQPCGPPCSGA